LFQEFAEFILILTQTTCFFPQTFRKKQQQGITILSVLCVWPIPKLLTNMHTHSTKIWSLHFILVQDFQKNASFKILYKKVALFDWWPCTWVAGVPHMIRFEVTN